MYSSVFDLFGKMVAIFIFIGNPRGKDCDDITLLIFKY